MLFTIEIVEDWLKTLDSLTETGLSGSKSTPEEALEAALFSEIKRQCSKMAELWPVPSTDQPVNFREGQREGGIIWRSS